MTIPKTHPDGCAAEKTRTRPVQLALPCLFEESMEESAPGTDERRHSRRNRQRAMHPGQWTPGPRPAEEVSPDPEHGSRRLRTAEWKRGNFRGPSLRRVWTAHH